MFERGSKTARDFFARIFDAQRAWSVFADGRRMMAEVVNQRHATRDSAALHPPLDALERVKSALNLFIGKPAML